jgi:hypothetical protein
MSLFCSLRHNHTLVILGLLRQVEYKKFVLVGWLLLDIIWYGSFGANPPYDRETSVIASVAASARETGISPYWVRSGTGHPIRFATKAGPRSLQKNGRVVV